MVDQGVATDERDDAHNRIALQRLSGIQQTGAGFYNADRPDQVGNPVLSTSRVVRRITSDAEPRTARSSGFR